VRTWKIPRRLRGTHSSSFFKDRLIGSREAYIAAPDFNRAQYLYLIGIHLERQYQTGFHSTSLDRIRAFRFETCNEQRGRVTLRQKPVNDDHRLRIQLDVNLLA
jgi:hypothetical protein